MKRSLLRSRIDFVRRTNSGHPRAGIAALYPEISLAKAFAYAHHQTSALDFGQYEPAVTTAGFCISTCRVAAGRSLPRHSSRAPRARLTRGHATSWLELPAPSSLKRTPEALFCFSKRSSSSAECNRGCRSTSSRSLSLGTDVSLTRNMDSFPPSSLPTFPTIQLRISGKGGHGSHLAGSSSSALNRTMTTSTSSLNSPSTGTQLQTRSVSDVRRHPRHEHRSLTSPVARSGKDKCTAKPCLHLDGRRRDRFLHLRVFVCLHASEMLRCASESSEESRKMLYMGSVSTMSGYFSAETPDKLVDGMQGIKDYRTRSIFDSALPDFIAWFEGDSGEVDLIFSCPPPAQHARLYLAAERITDAGTGRLGQVRQVPFDRAAERRTRVTRRSRLRRVDRCAARVLGLGRVDGVGRRSQVRALQVRIPRLPFPPPPRG